MANMKVVIAKCAAVLGAVVMLGRGAAGAQSSGADAPDMILPLLPFLILGVVLAWANYLLATKSGRSGIPYVILSIIPIVGFIATGYLIYTSLYRALDRRQI
jgi:hypothetical protein